MSSKKKRERASGAHGRAANAPRKTDATRAKPAVNAPRERAHDHAHDHAQAGTDADRARPALAVQPGPPVKTKDLPRASIVILNLNGKHHLQGCFESLAALEYPKDRLEVILIDNASVDGSVEEMKQKHPSVKLLVNGRNVGFSAGCNQGAREAAQPEVLVFLNNDMRVEKPWLAELVAPIVRGECQATTAKMFAWDGMRMNSAGGGMNFHGIGIQKGINEEPGPEYDVPMKTLFACGGAMAMDAQTFDAVGGFDEEFFAYYEDVDLGWRTWVEGYECRYVPSAVCYHHHSSTSKRLPPEMVRLLQVRNPLLACFKNYDDENLRTLLGPLMALAMRRMWVVSGLENDRPFRIEQAENPGVETVKRWWTRAKNKLDDKIGVRRIAAADLIGINDLLGRWDHWMKRRTEVQTKRRRSDAEIFELFLKPHWCIEGEGGYRELQRGLTQFMELDRLFPPDSLADPKG
jgi:GT2 family glycosyltransferase